ncbi:MAG: phage major capsid protein [Burkholderiales bacterium]|nr:phage major capsid protein [Burkholderiales bacterium]
MQIRNHTITLPPEALAAHEAAQRRFAAFVNAAGGPRPTGATAGNDEPELTTEEIEQTLARNRKVRNAIRADAEADGGPLSERQEHRLQEADEIIASCEVELEARGQQVADQPRHAVRNGSPNQAGAGRKTTPVLVDDVNAPQGASTAPRWRDTAGNEIRVFARGERLSAGYLRNATGRDRDPRQPGQQPHVPSIGETVRAMITGDWSRAGEIKNALSEGIDTDGGYMVLPVVSSQLIDLARDASVVFRAGAQVVPMTTAELDLVRVTGDPAIAWVAENKAIPKSQPTFGRLELRARKMACIVPLSRELAEDAPNAAAAIETLLSMAMAAELDRAALFGSGAGGEPIGLFNAEGVQSIGSIGALSYDDILDAIAMIEAANGTPNAYMLDAANKKVLAKQKDGQQMYLQAPADVASLQRLVTNKLSDAQGAVGDFREMLIGVRLGGVRIEISTQAGDASGSAFTEDQLWIKARWRGDVGFAHPEHFVKLLGITVS